MRNTTVPGSGTGVVAQIIQREEVTRHLKILDVERGPREIGVRVTTSRAGAGVQQSKAGIEDTHGLGSAGGVRNPDADHAGWVDELKQDRAIPTQICIRASFTCRTGSNIVRRALASAVSSKDTNTLGLCDRGQAQPQVVQSSNQRPRRLIVKVDQSAENGVEGRVRRSHDRGGGEKMGKQNSHSKRDEGSHLPA
ncbi:MAG: hypothetical protein WD733_10950 [Bryobacterales bacterium]